MGRVSARIGCGYGEMGRQVAKISGASVTGLTMADAEIVGGNERIKASGPLRCLLSRRFQGVFEAFSRALKWFSDSNEADAGPKTGCVEVAGGGTGGSLRDRAGQLPQDALRGLLLDVFRVSVSRMRASARSSGSTP